MSTRSEFLKTSGLAIMGLATTGFKFSAMGQSQEYTSKRPKPGNRKFVSEAVEEEIKRVKQKIQDKKLAWMFENCYPNTLDTTVRYQMKNGKPDTFVITGDINAMWLRDSSAQVWPYLHLANKDKKLKSLLAGVINRQTKCILIDPYANAFNYGPTGSPFDSDHTNMKPQLHERKWEVDSLCYPIRLAHGYWKKTGDTTPFDSRWHKAMQLVVKTFKQQQRKHGHGPYHFQRVTANPYDTVPLGGYGNPIVPVGMICSMFRGSDDATIYPFLVPDNYFAIVSLRQLADMMDNIYVDNTFAVECRALADEVEGALKKYAVINHIDQGKIYAYEVDGFGNRLFMDDANVPGLLSLPYLGCTKEDDPVYQNTRKFVLSQHNPYFFKGTAGEGIGGPHVGLNMIWPMSIIMRALTSSDDKEIAYCLKTLRNTDAGTGFMHESFNKDNPQKFTRKWFAWANTLFGELIIKVEKERPNLLSV
ncbi:MAG TPA: glycoside hydrolase family 125 protein [Balneolales bacterium]|nr:glycoside hydrolase family 125 protein [Balneolales bacterium]